MQQIFFVTSMLLSLYDLKAHEHKEAGEQLSNSETLIIPTSYKCIVSKQANLTLVRPSKNNNKDPLCCGLLP